MRARPRHGICTTDDAYRLHERRSRNWTLQRKVKRLEHQQVHRFPPYNIIIFFIIRDAFPAAVGALRGSRDDDDARSYIARHPTADRFRSRSPCLAYTWQSLDQQSRAHTNEPVPLPTSFDNYTLVLSYHWPITCSLFSDTSFSEFIVLPSPISAYPFILY